MMPQLFILFPPDAYLWAMAILLAILTAVFWRFMRRTQRKAVRYTALGAVAMTWGLMVYGTFVGVSRVEVRQIDLTFSDLPAQFDGYKIVHFSDAHVRAFTGFRKDILRRVVDSINAQQADAVVFTGDLQNKEPQELEPYLPLLGSIHARDGVFSVLGNHDYTMYLNTDDPYIISRNMGMTMSLQKDMGWTLLNNSRHIIRRDSARIVMAGMENDGEGRFPQLGNINDALYGISRKDFVIMLEHDPTAWRRKILPHSHTQLTLSGHTHGGQVALFGWSPAALAYKEHTGLNKAGARYLYVTSGVGGVIPFRVGVPPEIAVITLHTQ